MNPPKSPATEKEVIRLYLYGHTIEDIAKKCGTSTGYVSGVIDRLKEDLGQKEVSAIREFAVAMRKSGISAPQALIGAKIYSVICKSELDEDKLGELIWEVIEKAQNQGIPLSKLIEYSKIVSELQEKSSVRLEDLPMKYHNLLEEKNRVEKELLSLSQQEASAKTSVDNALEKKNLTIEKIEEFDCVKTELEKNNLDVNNLQRIVTILKKASDANYDSDKIISHLQKEETYENTIENLVEKQTNLQEIIEVQTKKLENITKEIKEKISIATTIRQFTKIGIEEQGLTSLYHMVTGISKDNNINAKDALQRLHEDLLGKT